MSTDDIRTLARAVGLSVDWLDYRGEPRQVADDALAAILDALGQPAGSRGDRAASLDRVEASRRRPAALMTVVKGGRTRLPRAPGAGRLVLHLETGEVRPLKLREEGSGQVSFRAPDQLGYHRLEGIEYPVTLAVTPRRALRIADVIPDRKLWGLAVQLYSLNEGGDFGDFGDLGRLCERIAPHGADAVAVSPTHALFTADLDRYAPYGPSTRLFLNPLYASTDAPRAGNSETLIDWRRGGEAKLARLRDDFAAFLSEGRDRAAFGAFTREGGLPLLAHARFEILDARFRARGVSCWRDWTGGYADADSAAVAALSPQDPEVAFHLYLQWRATLSLAAAQRAARDAGMAIGLITDLAVGMDGAGSHAWSRPADVMQGVSIGAPPDLLAPLGQSWGITTFSPTALRENGYAPFLQTLRAAMRHAGGVRIDHAMGLRRLWVTPDGMNAAHGAYLDYPFQDLLRLIALESQRLRAVVIGEDLGTVPPGFRRASTDAGVAGMRVLWFEQSKRGAFKPPAGWDKDAVALTTTHDLPTVAGWWRGRDIDWRIQLGQQRDPKTAMSQRRSEARRLWKAMQASGAARGDEPSADDPATVVDAALVHVGSSACDLALIAIEDVLGAVEQPNLPGTIDQHPNWRRRLPPGNGLDAPRAASRVARLDASRKQTS